LRFITKIKEIAKQGVTAVLDALGLEIDGSVSFVTPSW